MGTVDEQAGMKGLLNRLNDAASLPSVMMLVGESRARIRQALDALLGAVYPSGNSSLGLTVFNARESVPEQWLLAVRTRPMLGPKRVVVVEEAESWLAPAPSSGKGRKQSSRENESESSPEDQPAHKELDAVMDYLKNPKAAGLLILTARQADKRTRFSKEVVKARGLFDLNPFSGEISPRSFVQDLFRRRKVRIHEDALELLVETVGESADALSLEVDKLAHHVEENGVVTVNDVLGLVQRLKGHKLWDLVDATVKREAHEALLVLSRMFDSLVETNQSRVNQSGLPLILLAMLANRFEQMAALHSVSDQRLEELAVVMGTPKKPKNLWFMRKLRSEAHSFTREELEGILDCLQETDRKLKSTSTSPKLLMELLLVFICTKTPRRRRR